MDLETIKRINRDALRSAQSATGSAVSNQQLISVAVLAGIAVAVYFALQSYQPEIVMSVGPSGEKQFDQTRALVLSAVAGVLAFVAYRSYA